MSKQYVNKEGISPGANVERDKCCLQSSNLDDFTKTTNCFLVDSSFRRFLPTFESKELSILRLMSPGERD
jgi:hypothetical protein